MDNQAIGKRLRDARVAKGMTQEELAERAGLSPNHISVIERGIKSPQLDSFVSVCNALGVSADAVLIDVVDAATESAVSELSELLSGQPRDVQIRILRAVRAAIEVS